VRERRHNENDVTMTIAGLFRYGNWQRGHGLHGSSIHLVLVAVTMS